MTARRPKPPAVAPRLFVGTSGYAYPAWKGSFYPADLPASKLLSFYASRFESTELNHTFYKMPTPGQLEKSAALVPPGFRFSIKAPASITHRKDLEIVEPLFDTLAERVRALGERAGCLYLQLPPTLPCDLARLERFLTHAARVPMARAIELTHDTWNVPAVDALLTEYDTSRVHVDAEPVEDAPASPSTLRFSRRVGYVRLRRDRYDNAALDGWVQRIRAANPETVYVYFRHEDTGRGPKLAQRFATRWNRSMTIPK